MGDMKFYTPKISLFIIMMTVTNVCKGLIADEMECGNINVFNVFSSENMHIKAQVKDIKQYQDIFQESIGSYIDVVANISTPMVLRARIEFYIVRYSECSTETDEIYCNNLATRGVDSRDGLNSQVLDEEGLPIEMSTFDPPPEYNSLENTYQYIEPSRHSNEDKEDELPPSYKHVIKHTEEYKISTVFGYM
ncbi:hypothetical protein MAR_002151 [Mya arenaria]|uniref:Uncharacterized protein n=1 Tax=Mya arenaria TaxID=6604 RepID=A0ABY7FDS8_MYAAR|nr:hypothetical protein MAR_002151 [Mya arenaria]